jgi:acyl-CoA synthetase (AMP-forming)/AMP-acid ligase II
MLCSTSASILYRRSTTINVELFCHSVMVRHAHRHFIRLFSSGNQSALLWQKAQSQPHQQQVTAANWNPNLVIPPYVDEHLSYAYGRSQKELKYHTVGPMIDSMAKREPHSTAVVVYDEGISKNFEELRSDVYKLVNGMVSNLGLKRGDKIGVYSYNNYQFLLVQLACMVLGCVLNPFNPSYKAHEFSHVLGKSDIKVLFTTGRNSRQSSLNDHHSVVCDQSIHKLQEDGLLENLTHIVLFDGEMNERDLPIRDVKVCRWRYAFTDSSQIDVGLQKMIDEVRADDLYGVYYTSGTTGFPKGAAISQFNVINNVALSTERIFNQRGPLYKPMRPNVCLPLPLFHEFAGVLGMMLPFINGGSFVLIGLRYNIQSVVESIMRFKCNAIFLTPTILIDLITYVERNKLTNVPLRTMLVAGSKVLSELVNKTHKILPELEELRIGYGSSENGVIATIQTSEEAPETRALTVGPPLDFTEIRVVDVNTGETTLLGQSGEVQTRGFNTMVGYYKDPERTEEVITKSRWYKTGDLGIIDHRGSLQIVGRIKELIIKGGENVYPAEIETVLHAHQLIEDAHVFGVPDKRFGEEICVWIKLDKTKCDSGISEEELKKSIIEYCKKKLTYFKVPKYVMFVEEFPLTPVKKIKKFEMRARATKMLNL